jgi:hypothetical protein
MNVDVKIYMNDIKKFFDSNPKDLANLVPTERKEDFYIKVEERASENLEEGKDIPLTRQQLIDICVELNGSPQKVEDRIPYIFNSEFGKVFLN